MPPRTPPIPYLDEADDDSPQAPSLSTIELLDRFRSNTLRLLPDVDGGATVEIIHGTPDGDEDYHRMIFQLTEDDFARINREVIAPSVAYQAEYQAWYERKCERDDAERAQQDEYSPFALVENRSNPRMPYFTVHKRHCPVRSAGRASLDTNLTADAAAVEEALAKFLDRARQHLGTDNIRSRAARAKQGKRAWGPKYQPIKFCGRCKVFADDTARINQAIDSLMDAGETDMERFSRLDELGKEIRGLVWEATQRHHDQLGREEPAGVPKPPSE